MGIYIYVCVGGVFIFNSACENILLNIISIPIIKQEPSACTNSATSKIDR